AAIGMSGCVDAAAVDPVLVLEQIDYAAHEPYVIAFGRAVDGGVPVAGIAECLRIDGDETFGVGLVAHAGVLLEIPRAFTVSVQHYNERCLTYGVVVRRYV